MLGFKKATRDLRCSFCGKEQKEVERLIAGPDVYICNECVNICVEIIGDDKKFEKANPDLHPLE